MNSKRSYKFLYVLSFIFGIGATSLVAFHAYAGQPVGLYEGTFTSEINPFLGYYLHDSGKSIHLGDDINKVGTENDDGEIVYAANTGILTFAGVNHSTSTSGYRATITRTLSNDRIVCEQYLHMQDADDVYTGLDRATENKHPVISVSDRVGKTINEATPIGKISNTGIGTGPHLHYEVLLNYPDCATISTAGSAFENDDKEINKSIDPSRYLKDGYMSQVVTLKKGWTAFVPNFGSKIQLSDARLVKRNMTNSGPDDHTYKGFIDTKPLQSDQTWTTLLAFQFASFNNASPQWYQYSVLTPNVEYWIYSYEDNVQLVLYGANRQDFVKNDYIGIKEASANIRSEAGGTLIGTLDGVNGLGVKIISDEPKYSYTLEGGMGAWYQIHYNAAKDLTGKTIYNGTAWIFGDLFKRGDSMQPTGNYIPKVIRCSEDGNIYDAEIPPTSVQLSVFDQGSFPCPSVSPTPSPTNPPPKQSTVADIYSRTPLAITNDTVYVSSHLDTHGLSTKYYYQYGINNLGEHISAELPVNTYSTDNNASTLIQGLTCSTAYRYRIIVTNSAGMVAGPERFVTTSACTPPPPPPTATLGDLTLSTPQMLYCDATLLQNRLTWTASANAEGYRILRDGVVIREVSKFELSAMDNAISGTSPRYVVQAYAGNEIKNSNEVTVNSSSYCQDQANAHTISAITLSPQSIESSFARLQGAAWYHGGNDATIWFQYGVAGNMNLETLKRAPPVNDGDAFAYNADVSCGNTYEYRTAASSAYGIAYGNVVSFSTAPCPVILPPSNLYGSIDATGKITLTWQDTSSGENGFRITQSLNDGPWNYKYAPNPNDVSWSFGTLWYVGKFCYRVQTLDALFNLSDPSNAVCFTLPVPPVVEPPPPPPTTASPVITHIDDQSIAYNTLLTVAIVATDADTKPASLSYTADTLPTEAKLIWNKLYWKPTIDQVGTYSVTVHVSDTVNTTSQTFTITVTNASPVLAPVGDKEIISGKRLQFVLSALDPDTKRLTYSAVGLPAGATLNGKTFKWLTKITDGGTYPVTFSVTDGAQTVSETITIKVLERAPVITPIDPISVKPGTIIKFNLSASDPDGNALTYKADNLPTGASLKGKAFYWQPKKAAIGEHVITFRVSDGLLESTTQFKITVK